MKSLTRYVFNRRRSRDFSKFKIFAILDGELSSINPARHSPLVKKQIDAKIEPALEARLAEVSGASASDLSIRWRFGAARKASRSKAM
jgi:hypothetical protein